MSELNEAAEKLAAARKLVEELSETNNEFLQAERKISDEIKEHYRIVNDLESKKNALRSQAYDARLALAQAKRAIDDANKLQLQAEENERIRREYQELNKHFDDLMRQFSWFESAFPHQLEGAKKLAVAKRGVLGDKRGLGKTLTSLAWADLVGAKKILAIVPNDVMGNYEREVRMWAPHRSVHILGGKTKIERSFILEHVIKPIPDVMVIINYEAWRKDFNLLELLKDCQFDTVIADEAHMIKEMGTSAYRGVEAIVLAENMCYMCGNNKFNASMVYPYNTVCSECKTSADKFGDMRSVKNVLPMTGTPILNKPQDIFPLLHLVDPVMFADSRSFLNQYCVMDMYSGKWRFMEGGAERLTTKLSGVYVARDRNTAGIKIPKQTIQYHNLDLDPLLYPKQFEAYQILSKKSSLLVDDMLNSDDETNKQVVSVMYMIALITRQRQMMTWPAGIEFKHPKTGQVLYKCDVEESVKIDKIIDRNGLGMIPEFVLDEGERVVVFSQFKQPLKELERRLKDAQIRVVRYDGDTPKDKIQEIQMDFDRRTVGNIPKWDVILCHYKKGGVGLNLNAATQTILLDEEWNPGKEDQAFGRTDRMGQTEETTVHVLRVNGTVDVWLSKLIEEKAEMIAGFETQADLQQQLLDILRGINPIDDM